MSKNIKKKPGLWWHNSTEIFAACSEASNIGIVINIISKWIPEILTIAHGFLGGLSYYADVMIYVFKALIRLIKLAGRYGFNIQFDNEDQTYVSQKMLSDVLSLIAFCLTILSFAGIIASGAIGITLGWTFGLTGLGIVGYADYYLPKKQTELEFFKLYQDYLQGINLDIQTILLKHDELKTKNYELKLYLGLMIGLTFLLVFGSSAMFAPAGAAAVLTIISKIASIYLAMIAVFRFSNWLQSKLHEKPLDYAKIQDDFTNYCNSHSNESQEQRLIGFSKANKLSFFPPASSPSKLMASTLDHKSP